MWLHAVPRGGESNVILLQVTPHSAGTTSQMCQHSVLMYSHREVTPTASRIDTRSYQQVEFPDGSQRQCRPMTSTIFNVRPRRVQWVQSSKIASLCMQPKLPVLRPLLSALLGSLCSLGGLYEMRSLHTMNTLSAEKLAFTTRLIHKRHQLNESIKSRLRASLQWSVGCSFMGLFFQKNCLNKQQRREGRFRKNGARKDGKNFTLFSEGPRTLQQIPLLSKKGSEFAENEIFSVPYCCSWFPHRACPAGTDKEPIEHGTIWPNLKTTDKKNKFCSFLLKPGKEGWRKNKNLRIGGCFCWAHGYGKFNVSTCKVQVLNKKHCELTSAMATTQIWLSVYEVHVSMQHLKGWCGSSRQPGVTWRDIYLQSTGFTQTGQPDWWSFFTCLAKRWSGRYCFLKGQGSKDYPETKTFTWGLWSNVDSHIRDVAMWPILMDASLGGNWESSIRCGGFLITRCSGTDLGLHRFTMPLGWIKGFTSQDIYSFDKLHMWARYFLILQKSERAKSQT